MGFHIQRFVYSCTITGQSPPTLSIQKQSGVSFIRPIPLNALSGSYRKATKSKTVFPSDDRLLKMLYLFAIDIIDITKMGGTPPRLGTCSFPVDNLFWKEDFFQKPLKGIIQLTVSTYTMLPACAVINKAGGWKSI